LRKFTATRSDKRWSKRAALVFDRNDLRRSAICPALIVEEVVVILSVRRAAAHAAETIEAVSNALILEVDSEATVAVM